MEAEGVGACAAVASDGTAHPVRRAWEERCARVRCVAAHLRSDGPRVANRQLELLIEELLVVVDEGDSLVSSLALQTLHDALASINDEVEASKWIRRILQHSPATDSTSRFQLLRQLIREPKEKKHPNEDGNHGADVSDGEDDSSDDDLSAANCDGPTWYLLGILQNMPSYAYLLDAVLGEPSDRYHVVHEALMCLTDIVKRASHTERDTERLWDVVQQTVHCVSSWQFDGRNEVPTFIASDILDLIMDSRSLYHQTHGTDSSSPWVKIATATLKSSLSTLAMKLLLDESGASDDACAGSFVSMANAYPLVQKWIHLCCITASNLASLPAAEHPIEWDTAPSDLQLPTRTRLLTVLTEQDDILIDVAFELLKMGLCLDNMGARVPTTISLYYENELHPDLVFADLLHVFSDDHLVVLDMLMSSETRMLEYLLQYLRHSTTSWVRTQETWKRIDRAHSVMAVLIRLRMEMERLVDTGVFPYNPTPLLRRLEALERLYESEQS